MLGNSALMVTLDAHLMSFDRRTGEVLWERELADYQIGYSATGAFDTGQQSNRGNLGRRIPDEGFIDAFDPVSGERIWRFNTIPGPGEPGSETWPNDPSILAQGGGGTWMNGSFDPDLNLIYWGLVILIPTITMRIDLAITSIPILLLLWMLTAENFAGTTSLHHRCK